MYSTENRGELRCSCILWINPAEQTMNNGNRLFLLMVFLWMAKEVCQGFAELRRNKKTC